MAKYGGKSSSVTINGTARPGQRWGWRSDTAMVEATTFLSALDPDASGGVWDEWLTGFSNAEGFIDEMWDDSFSIPGHGVSATFIGYVGGGHGVSFTAFFQGGEHGSEVKGAGKRSLRFKQTGKPTFF